MYVYVFMCVCVGNKSRKSYFWIVVDRQSVRKVDAIVRHLHINDKRCHFRQIRVRHSQYWDNADKGRLIMERYRTSHTSIKRHAESIGIHKILPKNHNFLPFANPSIRHNIADSGHGTPTHLQPGDPHY